MSDNAGSYAFGEFDENDKELTRLKHQASIALELERGFWHKLGLEEGMDLLDVACGPGITACELARLVFPGQVTGLDINDALIQVARGVKDEQQTANVAFNTGDVYKLPYKEQFDFAYARFLFQHLERPRDALKNIFSSLRPVGGSALWTWMILGSACTPKQMSLRRLPRWLRKDNTPREAIVLWAGNFRLIYSKPDLKSQQ